MFIEESRACILHEFLERRDLQGWRSWRPDESLLKLGHAPYWGILFLLYLRSAERIWFAPEQEPRETLVAEFDLILNPWEHLGCTNPFEILCDRLYFELDRRHLVRHSIGSSSNPGRSSLPILSAEQPPLSERVVRELTRGMANNAKLDDVFAAFYQLKTAHEIEQIRIANRVAFAGLVTWRVSCQWWHGSARRRQQWREGRRRRHPQRGKS